MHRAEGCFPSYTVHMHSLAQKCDLQGRRTCCIGPSSSTSSSLARRCRRQHALGWQHVKVERAVRGEVSTEGLRLRPTAVQQQRQLSGAAHVRLQQQHTLHLGRTRLQQHKAAGNTVRPGQQLLADSNQTQTARSDLWALHAILVLLPVQCRNHAPQCSAHLQVDIVHPSCASAAADRQLHSGRHSLVRSKVQPQPHHRRRLSTWQAQHRRCIHLVHTQSSCQRCFMLLWDDELMAELHCAWPLLLL